MSNSNCNLSKTLPTVKDKPVNYWNVKSKEIPLSKYESLNPSGLFSYHPYLQKKNRLFVFQNLLTIHDSSGTKQISHPPLRHSNDIITFSRNSRLRLMRITSKICLDNYAEVVHCTFTFHNSFPSQTDDIKKLFKNFWNKLNYNFPGTHFVWRLDFQKRGAPHYHIIFLFPLGVRINDGEYFRLVLSKYWLESINETSIPAKLYGVKCTRTKEPKKFFAYVSKYAAKIEEVTNENYKARRWGYSRELDQSVIIDYYPDKELMKVFKRNLHAWLKKRNRMSRDFENVFFEGDCINVFIGEDEFQQIYFDSMYEILRRAS